MRSHLRGSELKQYCRLSKIYTNIIHGVKYQLNCLFKFICYVFADYQLSFFIIISYILYFVIIILYIESYFWYMLLPSVPYFEIKCLCIIFVSTLLDGDISLISSISQNIFRSWIGISYAHKLLAFMIE